VTFGDANLQFYIKQSIMFSFLPSHIKVIVSGILKDSGIEEPKSVAGKKVAIKKEDYAKMGVLESTKSGTWCCLFSYPHIVVRFLIFR
jgi:hypothetical protein